MALRLSLFGLLLCTVASAQKMEYLSPPPKYPDGGFISPNTTDVYIFSEGSTMNVSWETKYPSINLYLITGTEYNTARTQLIGTTQTWFEWEVSAYGNNSQPFSFRAVNAQGTAQEKSGGGFYTGQFWIRQESSADDKPSSTITTASSTTATPSETPKAEVTDQKPTDVTSNPPPSSTPTSASQNATSTSDTTNAAQTSSSKTLPAAPVTTNDDDEAVDTEGKTVNNNDTSNNSNNNSDSNDNNGPDTTLLGVGIGVGVGVGVTAASIGVWVFLWRRRRRNRNRNSGGRKNEADEQGGQPAEKRDHTPDQSWYGEAAHRNEKSGGLRAHVDAFELPPQGAVIEAPGHRMDPCELAIGR